MIARRSAVAGIAVAVVAGVLTLAAVLPAIAAAPPPSTPDDYELPAGYRELVDDTARISVGVPDDWDEVVTAPLERDGAIVPRIEASTGPGTDTFEAAGVSFTAIPFTDDPEGWYEQQLAGESGCAEEAVVDYDDGAFAGRWWQLTGCGGGGSAQLHHIVASPANRVMTAVVAVTLRGPDDQAALDVVIASFNLTASATWPATVSSSEPTSSAVDTAPPATDVDTTAPSTAVETTPPSTDVDTTPPDTTSSTSGVTTTSTSATSSSTTSTSAPSTSSTLAPLPTLTPLTTVPTGARALVDRTGSLGVSVPSSWTDLNTAASVDDSGLARPTIVASPNIDDFLRGYATPGLRLFAMPATVEPATILGNVDYSNQCTAGVEAPFDDGRFSGLTRTWSSCEQTSTQLVVVAARPADATFTLFVEVQSPANDPAIGTILGSFGLLPGTLPPSPEPVTTTTAIDPFDVALLQGPVPAGAVTVVDSFDAITIDVPAAWSDRRTDGLVNDDLSDRSRIIAAPDAESMLRSWSTPGVVFVEYPAGDARQLLANRGYGESCTDGGLQRFDGRGFTGYAQTWSSCGDTVTRILAFAVRPADGSALLYLEVQLPDADDTGLRSVLATFRQL